jgi:hypothetical protein
MSTPRATGFSEDERALRDLVDALKRLIAARDAGVARMRVTTKEGSAEIITRRA